MGKHTLSRPPIPSLVKSQSLLIIDCVAAFLRGKQQKLQCSDLFNASAKELCLSTHNLKECCTSLSTCTNKLTFEQDILWNGFISGHFKRKWLWSQIRSTTWWQFFIFSLHMIIKLISKIMISFFIHKSWILQTSLLWGENWSSRQKVKSGFYMQTLQSYLISLLQRIFIPTKAIKYN